MGDSKNEEHDLIITFGDCVKILKKGSWIIAASAAICSAGFAFYSLTKPILYVGEATFKEKGNSHAGVASSSLASIILSGFSGGSSSEAKTIMRSRSFLEKVVKSQGLQATLSQPSTHSLFFKTIKENARIEYFNLRKRSGYPLPDIFFPLRAENVNFTGEIPLSFRLEWVNEEAFHLYNLEGDKLGTGLLGHPFSKADFRFTLTWATKDSRHPPLTGTVVFLTLSPLADVAKALAQQVTIEPNKEDSALLKLSYRHRDRHQACELLNQIMVHYQEHLREEQQRIALEQIAYLYKREQEMGENLKEMIDLFADKIKAEVSDVGYPDSEKAMQFLTAQLLEHKKRVIEIDLDLKMHQRLVNREAILDIPIASEHTPTALVALLAEIRKLKQQSDAIELALRNPSDKNKKEWESGFLDQVKELEEIRRCAEEAKAFVPLLKGEPLPRPVPYLFDNAKYMVRCWYDQLVECENSYLQAPRTEKAIKKSQRDHFKGQFISYLTNLVHFLDVKEKAVQEQLSHQQAPHLEFQGINLEAANDLYIEHSKRLSESEAEILQLEFMLEEIQNPDFEVSSLSIITKDPVAKELTEKASEYVLAIQDDSNRGIKEKERIKKELLTQKKFLAIHLRQTIQLLQLKEDLMKEKIHSLQKAALSLIQQQLSILEHQLTDGIEAHLKTLKQEKLLIQQHEAELKQEMAKLPKKWASEKMIEHQVKMNTAMVEELTKLVESKNIANHLEMVQSAPMDRAIPSVKPVSPKMIFFSILGAVLGVLLSMGGLLVQVLTSGIRASRQNLELSGVHVSGAVAAAPESNIETWRRLIAQFDRNKQEKGKSLALIEGSYPDQSEQIGGLLSKRGDKVVILDLRFSQSPQADQLPALLQMLSGETDFPKILQLSPFDTIASGGQSSFTAEWIQSKRFKDLLSTLVLQYDWVIGISNAKPSSPEAEILIHLFNHAAIFIAGETLSDLSKVIKLAKRFEETKVSFLTT